VVRAFQRLRRATVSLDRVPRGRKMTVLFVEETLGY